MESIETIKTKIKNDENVNIAVGLDQLGWHEKFADALNLKLNSKNKFRYSIIDIDKHDWVDRLQPYDILIWKPFCLGPESSLHFKEKIYFINTYLNKLTLPNLHTIWHYDSKIAQSYMFSAYDIPTPKTMVSFEYQNSLELINKLNYPVIEKKSWGAASKNVRLLKNLKMARRVVDKTFYQTMWDNIKETKPFKMKLIKNGWFFKKLLNKILFSKNVDTRFPYLYLQEFIPNNSMDLRVTVIGDRYAFGFWRKNRENDFRASGSGNIDYKKEIPISIINQMMLINSKLDFDSMAYDILFINGKYLITEMSYAYLDTAIFNAPGYYELTSNGINFQNIQIWPQSLWIEWLFIQLGLSNFL